jgi:hypothetical protein
LDTSSAAAATAAAKLFGSVFAYLCEGKREARKKLFARHYLKKLKPFTVTSLNINPRTGNLSKLISGVAPITMKVPSALCGHVIGGENG